VRTALIVGDLQVGITRDYPFAGAVVAPVAAVLPAARAAGVLPVFVHTALRRNRTDLADTNPLMTAFFDTGETFREGAPETEVDPRLGAGPEDVTVLKRRASAFAGTDLDLVLRARGVDGVVIAGVATSAMVAATAYDAADRDYRVTVLTDAVADADPDLHRAVLDLVFPARGFARTTTTAWLA
jgi:nicotinamidase-related amidase